MFGLRLVGTALEVRGAQHVCKLSDLMCCYCSVVHVKAVCSCSTNTPSTRLIGVLVVFVNMTVFVLRHCYSLVAVVKVVAVVIVSSGVVV